MPHIRLRPPSFVRHRLARLMRQRPWSISLDRLVVDLTDADLRADLDFGRD